MTMENFDYKGTPLQYPYIRDVVSDVVHGFDPLADVSSIALTPNPIAITGTATQQLVATATLRDGTTRVVTTQCTYVSATPSKATVSAAGLVTGVAASTSVISATYQGITATDTCTVS